MSTDPRTVPAALDRLAHQLPDHDALITEERSFTSAERRRRRGHRRHHLRASVRRLRIRISAPDGGETGEVLLRGPNVMLGYLDDPAATAAAIDDDGWLHTGDIGAVDDAGNLRITDRLKDMYICGGFNVYPAEVEQVLARMDGVADAAVIGVPDERLGEVGRAFLVPRPDSDLDEQSVIAYTREHLANFKAPRSVRFVDELPRNAGGKVLKPQLRELA